MKEKLIVSLLSSLIFILVVCAFVALVYFVLWTMPDRAALFLFFRFMTAFYIIIFFVSFINKIGGE